MPLDLFGNLLLDSGFVSPSCPFLFPSLFSAPAKPYPFLSLALGCRLSSSAAFASLDSSLMSSLPSNSTGYSTENDDDVYLEAVLGKNCRSSATLTVLSSDSSLSSYSSIKSLFCSQSICNDNSVSVQSVDSIRTPSIEYDLPKLSSPKCACLDSFSECQVASNPHNTPSTPLRTSSLLFKLPPRSSSLCSKFGNVSSSEITEATSHGNADCKVEGDSNELEVELSGINICDPSSVTSSKQIDPYQESSQRDVPTQIDDGSIHSNDNPFKKAPENLAQTSPSLVMFVPECFSSTCLESQPVTMLPEKRKKYREARKHILNEIYQTEFNYVNNIETFLRTYRLPLRNGTAISTDHKSSPTSDRVRNILPLSDIKIIFAFFDEILDFSRHLLLLLESAVKSYDSREDQFDIGGNMTRTSDRQSQSLAEIFLQNSEKLGVYMKFIDNYAAAKRTTQKAASTNDSFRIFIADTMKLKEVQRQSITDYLILPVQRITRYVLLFQDFKKHTPDDHPDYSQLLHALDAVRNVATRVNEVKKQEEEMTRMFSVVTDVENCPPNIISFQRRLIYETRVLDLTLDYPQMALCPISIENSGISIVPTIASLSVAPSMELAHSSPIHLFIFSDLILLAKERCKKRREKNMIKSASSGSSRDSMMTLFRIAWLHHIYMEKVSRDSTSKYLVKLTIQNSDSGNPLARKRFFEELATVNRGANSRSTLLPRKSSIHASFTPSEFRDSEDRLNSHISRQSVDRECRNYGKTVRSLSLGKLPERTSSLTSPYPNFTELVESVHKECSHVVGPSFLDGHGAIAAKGLKMEMVPDYDLHHGSTEYEPVRRSSQDSPVNSLNYFDDTAEDITFQTLETPSFPLLTETFVLELPDKKGLLDLMTLYDNLICKSHTK